MYSDAHLTLTGNLTREPELKMVGTSKVCSFSIAVNSGKKDEEGKSIPNYYNISAWGVTADYLMEKLTTGTQVEVVGDLVTSAYISKKDGLPKADCRVTAFDVKPRARLKGWTKQETAAAE